MVLPPDVLHKLEQVLDGALPSYSVQYAKLFPRPRRPPSPDQVVRGGRAAPNSRRAEMERDREFIRTRQIDVSVHVGQTLIRRMFGGLVDGYRFFIKDISADIPTMIATKLKTSSITPSLHILVLRITPTPPAYYGKWEVDIACLARHCFATFGQDMSLKDFLGCFAWDDAAYIDAFEKTYIWQEEVEKRIQMDARIKAMARRWHLLVLLMRAKGILKRWFLLAAAAAFDAWAPWARRHAFAKKIREEAQKKRVLDLKRWVIKTFKMWLEALAKDRLDREEDGRLRAPVREFLRCHPFIKTPDQAFLAGVTSPAKVFTVGGEGVDSVGFMHTDVGGSLAKFVKLHPLKKGAGANWNKEDQGVGGGHRAEGSGEGDDDGGRHQGEVGDGGKAGGGREGREEGGGKLAEGSGSDDDLGNGSKKKPQPTPPYAPGGFGLRGSLDNRGEFRQKWRAGEGRIVQLKLGSRGQTVPGPYADAKRIHIPEDRDALLDVTPSVVHFEDFMHLGVPLAKRTVSVTNVGGTLRRLRVMPAQSPFFTVTSTLLRNKGRLAPGMTATISIVFTPQEKRTYYDCCVIEVEGEAGRQWGAGLSTTARLQLPMHANPAPKLVAPDIGPSSGFNAIASNLKPVQKMYRVEQLALSHAEAMRTSLANDLVEQDEGVPRTELLKDVARALAELEHEIFLGTEANIS